jgi:hypothetical protein
VHNAENHQADGKQKYRRDYQHELDAQRYQLRHCSSSGQLRPSLMSAPDRGRTFDSSLVEGSPSRDIVYQSVTSYPKVAHDHVIVGNPSRLRPATVLQQERETKSDKGISLSPMAHLSFPGLQIISYMHVHYEVRRH